MNYIGISAGFHDLAITLLASILLISYLMFYLLIALLVSHRGEQSSAREHWETEAYLQTLEEMK
jgi:hypothetical protein